MSLLGGKGEANVLAVNLCDIIMLHHSSNCSAQSNVSCHCLHYDCSAGNNFYLFRGHMSFQIFFLVGHLTNWTGHNLLTDNTLKKRT